MTPEADRDPVGDLLTRGLPPGPDPDAARLAALRAASLAAFADVPPTSPRRTKPMTHLLRLAAGLVAAGVAFALLYPSPPSPDPVRQALDEVASADRHFRLAEEARTLDLFSRADALRFEETPDRYTLVQGEAGFAIDEAANRFTRLAAADRDRLRGSGWDVRASAVVGSSPYEGGVTYRLDPPAEVDLDAAGKFVALRRYAAGRLVATLTLFGNAPPMPDDKFALKNTLSEDGRVGKVTDVQGLASIKPVGATRFTPLRPNTLVMPGDYLQVDARGANAVTVRLLPEATLVVGPGSIVEVSKPTKLRVLQGEVEVTPTKGTPVELRGPGDTALTLAERGFYRLTGDKLARVPADPAWLKSLKGTSVNESLGSLVAQVDGRAVSLSVGVHKVNVEVRDQIARTTIEETFVNHTDFQLEGVFHFPLPQDASIAGFAMWIGNEKVEADVVEKQRAREIFETILREKRDPGLLEWAGGNLFKARVFPIFAHSEKRVSITYTQVLPAVGNAVRYSYALQSEMLRVNPLKELSVTVTVNSALPMKAVTSPTHPCRAAFAGTSAKLEFVAQNYTPTADFEAVIELADAAPAVTLIPHRRGSDGYFLLQVTPPAPPQSGRELVTSDAPLSLLLWCDTSASIDAGQRRTQAALSGALLTALTPKDTFNLAVTDVATLFAFGSPTPATPENVNAARDFLAKRASLGWSNLEGGLTAVLAQSPPGTHVVYLGDGVAGTVVADPQAAAVRLGEAYQLAAKPVTVHAVALGSSFESGVLTKLASLGGGSSRRVSGDQSPTKVALDILGEVTRPPVRNVTVAFTGLKTAKVYPELLPNLTPGTQQILLGRYLPEGTDQKGEVVVTGTQAGREVRFTAAVTLKDAEAGNSFLPRLWARLHLDKLLEGPQSPTTKDDVIGLSEEFHIMTPYTSFLVLESDADRLRFSVKRRFEMRDGEQFFADGKKAATYALAREQMKLAGLWRAGLRRSVMNRLANLERQPPPATARGNEHEVLAGRGGQTRSLMSSHGGANRFRYAEWEERSGMMSVQANVNSDSSINGGLHFGSALSGKFQGNLDLKETQFEFTDGDSAVDLMSTDLTTPDIGLDPEVIPVNEIAADDPIGDFKPMRDRKSRIMMGEEMLSHRTPQLLEKVAMSMNHAYGFMPDPQSRPPATDPLDALFPQLPPVPTDTPAKSPWAKEATDLATLVYRRPTLAALPGGLTIERSTQYLNPRQATGEHRSTELLSPKRWATRHTTDTAATSLDWCDGASRFAVNGSFNLARRRDAKPADLAHPPVNGFDHSMSPLWEQYGGTAKVEAGNVIVMTSADGRHVVRITIDATKKVVTRVVSSYEGAPSTTVTTSADFVQVRGLWWPTTIESATGGKVQSRTTQTVTATDDGAFAKAFDALTAPLAKCVVQRVPYPKLPAAKAALIAAKATTDDRFTLLRQALAYQRFDEATAELDAIDKLEAGKPGLTWLRVVLQMASRRNEEARQRMLAAVPEVLALPTPGDQIAKAQWLTQQASSILSYPEQRQLRDKFAALITALPVTHGTRRDWVTLYYYALTNAGDGVEAFAYLKARVAEDPTSFDLRILYLQLLYGRGERDAATSGLREIVAAKDAWQAYEVSRVYGILADFQEREGKLPAKLETLTAWLAFAPADGDAAWRLLSALVRTDAEPKADALVNQWLAEAKVPTPTPAQLAKALAAVRHVAGQADRLPADRLDPKWVAVLADAARFDFATEKPSGVANAVLYNSLFQQTDAGPKLVAELFGRVLDGVAGRPLPRLANDLSWLTNAQGVERDRWVKLAAAVQARWATIADDEAKHALGQQLAQLIRQRIGSDEALAFTRLRLKSAPAKYLRSYQADLFDTLQGVWNEARAEEAYDLVPAFLTDADGKPTTADAVSRLMRLNDWVMQAREAQLQGEVKNPERLTRPELKAKREEATRQARGELLARLTKREATYPVPLKSWAKLERLTYQAKHDSDANAIAAELFALLGDAPLPVPAEDAEVTPDQVLAFDFQARAVGLAMHAVTRKAATPEAVAKLRAFLDAGVAAQPKHDGWKQAKYDLLIALDLPKELEGNLTAWARAGDPTAQWRTALGYLLAELGRLKEAIAVFEGVTEIDAAAYGRSMALSRLYLAVDDQAKHDAAKANAYRELSEQQLGQLLQAKYAPWLPRPGVALPTELDADTLPILAALVGKTANIDSYLGTVQGLYRASKDFRIPATVADAALGQTPGRVYAVVTRMQSLLNDVRDEASADTLFARVEALRPKAKSPTDLRALDLIAMQIHRRAAEVRNQPGPHAELALAAFRRAYDRPWADGEKVLMAGLLRDFGNVTPEALASEQLRQLKGLTDATPAGTLERLQVSDCYAATLHGRAKTVEAIGVLTPDLAAFVAANKGLFTPEAQPAAGQLAGFHEARNDFAAAEKLWLGWRAAAANDQLKVAAARALDALYLRALRNDGEVSLGKGEGLYAALLARLNERLHNPEPNERSQTLSAFEELFRAAGAKLYGRTGADVLALANGAFPALVSPWEQSYHSHVRAVAELVRLHAGGVYAWAFLLDRVEATPARLRPQARHHNWSAGSNTLAPGNLPEPLQARLVKILVADLTGELRARRMWHQAGQMVDARYGYYWTPKEAEFAAAAEAVLAEAKDSVPTQLHVADYLFHGCHRTGRAIDVLSELHRAKRLDLNGRGTLSHYLMESKRYAEAVAILVPLTDESADDANLRFRLMTAYARLGKPAEARDVFNRSVARWKERNAWTVHTMPGFADAAQDCDLHAEAAGVYAELIPNVQRLGGAPNGSLAEYYRRHAVSLSRLGKHVEAVDAASGAVVAWGGDLNRRQAALVTLSATVQQAADLEALVAHFDKQTAETGLVNPILRKALGQAYAARQNYRPAVAQLELAVEAQPNDPEAFALLIEAYDKSNRKPEAVARILQSLDLSRRDLKRYADLGHRYAAAGDAANAERAFTSLVEVTRGEAEGQTLLAQIRQSQDRWAEALPHWGQVDAVRSLEPAGLLGLAEAQLHLKQYDAAKATLQKLRAKPWPPHAGDVPAKVRELEAKLPK